MVLVSLTDKKIDPFILQQNVGKTSPLSCRREEKNTLKMKKKDKMIKLKFNKLI